MLRILANPFHHFVVPLPLHRGGIKLCTNSPIIKVSFAYFSFQRKVRCFLFFSKKRKSEFAGVFQFFIDSDIIFVSGRGDFAFSDRVDYGAALLAQVRAAAVPALAEILFKLRKAEKQLVGREIFFAVEIEAGKAGRVGDKMPVGERK